nr:rho-related GTP-binding protein RhoV [Castor canadensis]
MPPRELSEAEPPPLRTPTPPPRRRSATPELGIKCVLVGDGAVGKSSLIVSYTCNGYPACYRPTALDTFSVQVLVDGAPVRIELWDTAGQEDFDRLRSLCYPDTDVFLACFSVVQPSSFQNITEKWLPEIRTHNPQAPVLLVGTQADLRTMSIVLIQLRPGPEGPVPQPQAQGLAEKIRACCYLECSLDAEELEGVFDSPFSVPLSTKLAGEETECQGCARSPAVGRSSSVCLSSCGDVVMVAGGRRLLEPTLGLLTGLPPMGLSSLLTLDMGAL